MICMLRRSTILISLDITSGETNRQNDKAVPIKNLRNMSFKRQRFALFTSATHRKRFALRNNIQSPLTIIEEEYFDSQLQFIQFQGKYSS